MGYFGFETTPAKDFPRFLKKNLAVVTDRLTSLLVPVCCWFEPSPPYKNHYIRAVAELVDAPYSCLSKFSLPNKIAFQKW